MLLMRMLLFIPIHFVLLSCVYAFLDALYRKTHSGYAPQSNLCCRDGNNGIATWQHVFDTQAHMWQFGEPTSISNLVYLVGVGVQSSPATLWAFRPPDVGATASVGADDGIKLN